VVFILHLILLRTDRWQKKTFFSAWLVTTNSRGAFRLQGSGKMSEVLIKERDNVAFLPRFGGGSGGRNNICNDGMGATAAGNRHHNQRI
jgi:hypothetical protein